MKTVLSRLGLLGALCLLNACGGGKRAEAPPIRKQSASDEILRISEVWTSALPSQGILSNPSPISLYKNVSTSEITLSADGGHEVLVLEEQLELRAGGTVHCSTKLEHDLGVRFGRRQGEPAVEIVRPPLQTTRNCNAPHPDGLLDEPRRRALFVLRSDQLIAVEPPLEKRAYLPRSM